MKGDEEEEDGAAELFFPNVLICFVCIFIISILLSLYIEMKIYNISSLGSPSDGRVRVDAGLQGFVEFKLRWFPLLQVTTFIFGVLSLHFGRTSADCKNTNVMREFWYIDLVILMTSLAAEILLSLLGNVTVMLRRCFKQKKHNHSSYEMDDPDSLISIHGAVEDAWENRCKNMCLCMARSTCYLFGGSQVQAGEYDQIARVLADYFEGFEGAHIDLVASDIVAGFVMLGKLQRKRASESFARIHWQKDNSMFLSTNNTQRYEESRGSPSNPTTALLDKSLHHSPSSSNISTLRLRNKSPSPSNIDLTSLDRPEHNNIPVLSNNYNANVSLVRQNEGSSVWYDVSQRKPLVRENSFDREVVYEGARFVRHALAIYSWMLYVYMAPCSGSCRLCIRCTRMKQSCCVFCTSNDSRKNVKGRISGDNMCGIHEAALLQHAGLEQSDLIYAQFDSSFTHTPYCIIVDHKWKSIVLSIRGTLSLEDCVTDVLVEPKHLDEFAKRWGFYVDARNEYVHSGVLQCSEWVLEDLSRHGLLDSLLGKDFPDYRLRICGHSLGAGIATLLSFVFRSKYPNLLCLAYSPPGGLLTTNLANGCKDFVYSFVLDSDIVPRLSVQTMEILRDEVLEMIVRIRVPKIIIAESVFNDVLGNTSAIDDLDSYLYPRNSVPNSTLKFQLDRLKAVQNRRKVEFRGPSVMLYPPGKIVHLIKVNEEQSCAHGMVRCLTCGTTNFGNEYIPIWAENSSFNEIVISPTMGTDHFPNRVCLELEKIAKEMFRFDLDMEKTEELLPV